MRYSVKGVLYRIYCQPLPSCAFNPPVVFLFDSHNPTAYFVSFDNDLPVMMYAY